MNPERKDLYIEPMQDAVNRVYERFLDPPESLTFDEMLTTKDRTFLRTIMVGERSAK